MRKVTPNPYDIALLLIWAWTDTSIDCDVWWRILHALDLGHHGDELLRLFHRCEKHNVSLKWTIEAIIWKLNNL